MMDYTPDMYITLYVLVAAGIMLFLKLSVLHIGILGGTECRTLYIAYSPDGYKCSRVYCVLEIEHLLKQTLDKIISTIVQGSDIGS